MIIFVAGIHGVGKTYLGGPAAKELGLLHATASQLIREERGLSSWGDDKRVSSVDENQAALISAVRRHLANGQRLLLDGHFVLRTAVGEHTEIDVQVFADLGIGAVILLEAPHETVHGRLVTRGDSSWTAQELSAFSQREAEHAKNVSSQLGIELYSLHSPSEPEFTAAIEAVLNRRVQE